jgi:sporulation protein YunB
MRGRRRRLRSAGRPAAWGLAAVALALLALWFDRSTAPTLQAFAQREARSLAVLAIERAVRQQLGGGLRYDDLVVVHRDSQGRVTLIQVDTVRLSRLLASLQGAIQGELAGLERAPIGIPLGVVLGSDLLAAYGPRLRAAVLPVGTVSVGVQQRFEQAGINQARHVIVATVEARMRVAVPLHAEELLVRTELPLVDTVIVGPVPEQWFGLPWPAAPGR